uniref:Synaptotagmin-13 n=1 Tax=Sphaerodactylus townsendi TaxID=933632 RepID=A0ACB8G3P0_9SAUR
MVLSVPMIALGATLGTATSILALCGLTCLCKCKRPGKGPSDKEQDLDPENAKPTVLQTVQQEDFRAVKETKGEGGSGGLWDSQSNSQLLFH